MPVDRMWIAAMAALGFVACDDPAVTSTGDGGAGPSADGGASADAVPVEPDARQPDADRGPSSGCGHLGAGVGVKTRTLTVDGVERTYVRFVPPDYDPHTPMALVIGFHGSGGEANATRARFDLEEHAGGAAVFVYPQALPSTDPAFDGQARWEAHLPDSHDYAFFDALVSQVEASHCIDRDRIFATGFSLGARFTANLGCWRGDVLRAIAPVAPGKAPETLPLVDCVGEVAVWEGLGTKDLEHEAGAVRVREHYAAANGCAATRTPTTPDGCEAYDGCRPEVPVTWCTYPLGHVWPPIAPAGVWSFFAGFE